MRIERHPLGPRVYILGLRWHHGPFGCLLIVVGAALVAHDRHDFPWRLRERASD